MVVPRQVLGAAVLLGELGRVEIQASLSFLVSERESAGGQTLGGFAAAQHVYTNCAYFEKRPRSSRAKSWS
jgi:hypothetical protein